MVAFDITQAASTTQTIQVQFPPSTISTINSDNDMITGFLTTDSSTAANVTILNGNFPVNSFVATRFYVVGNQKSTSSNKSGFLTTFQYGAIDQKGYLTPLTDDGLYGELVIEGKDSNTQEKMRLCYLLFTDNRKATGTTSLVQMLQQPSSQTKTVDFGSAISGAFVDAKATPAVQQSYITYSLDNCTYIICTVPIYVLATLAFTNMFDLGASRVKSYTVINAFDDATWMECDYAPMGTETVNVLQVPIGSVSDLNSDQSFRQIVFCLVFLIFLVIFYLVISPFYKMIVMKFAGGNENALCTTMSAIDWGYNIVLTIVWSILLLVGTTSKEDSAPNVLNAFFVVFTMHMLIFGTIHVGKFSPDFPFQGREQRCTAQQGKSNNQSQSQSRSPSQYQSQYEDDSFYESSR